MDINKDIPLLVSVTDNKPQSGLRVHEGSEAEAGTTSGSDTGASALSIQPPFQQLSSSEQEELRGMLCDDVREMKRLFGSLVTTTCDSVEERIPVVKFAKHILALGAYDPAPEERDRSLLDEHRQEIKGAKSISEIFIILSAYWNYLNYEVLEYIIKHYGTSEDTERLRDYNEKLHNFCKRRLFEVPMPVRGNGTENKSSPKQEELYVKLDVREDIPADQFNQIKRKIAKILHVRPATLQICRITKGCVQLIFLIPKFVAQEIFPLSREQTSALSKDVSVIRLECGDYTFEAKMYIEDAVTDSTVLEGMEDKSRPQTEICAERQVQTTRTNRETQTTHKGLVDPEAFIKELSKHIGEDWKALARELGLSKTDIDAIEYDNCLSMKDQIFEFFYKWKQQEGKDVSVQKLIDGLKAAKLEEQLKKMHEAGLTPESHLQRIRQQRLKRFLSDKSDSSPLLPGSPRETQRTLSTGSATSGEGEQECPPPLLLTKEGDLSTTTDGNTKPPADRHLEVGDLVKVEQKDSPWYGVIRWIGQLPGSLKCIAGIEMEDNVKGGHSGGFKGVQYFECPPGHGLFFPVDRLKRDDRFEEDDIETDENRRLSGNLPKSAERDTLHQQLQVSPDERFLRPQSHESTSQECSPVNKAERSQSSESTLDALKALEAARLSSSPGNPETSSEDSSDKPPFKGLVFYIPGDRTGMVIGKEGKNIRQVESETNTSIKVIERSEQAQLSQNTTVAIIGSEENCKRALYIILENLRRKIFQQLATTETIQIPNQLVGRVIGKGGSTCNAIEKLSGAQVKVENREDLQLLLDDTRTCKITGMAEHIEEAKELIKRAMQGADIVQEATFAAVMVKLIKYFEEMGFEFPE